MKQKFDISKKAMAILFITALVLLIVGCWIIVKAHS
jgi:hypothetical protein